jgi:hypothetical protein
MARRLLELQPNFRSGPMLGFLGFTRPELVEALTTGASATGVPE